MGIIKNLVETSDSEKMKSVKMPFENYEDMGFRMLKEVKISDEIGLAIQASYVHYCSPRKTLPLEEYTKMELAIFKDGEFTKVSNVTGNESIINKLDEYYEGTVYGFVPVDLIEELYQALITNT